ncbi:NAD(P)-dependent alcohol dehydrogenase [Persicitalea jodogahamensis]|uniref:NADPH:quinone oxidoreductase n=1 Tax=Persicitalea jodogahamensis TaxID=402147 RepID=A0A8J3G7J1_9BACT|nr:NAD(P)-dependent alcohol dehydrogenase [Persicitalea jodogahamensis]GHB56768.1 NADPH:quinone oxidoreductase [Persicitalea jodogahamensis]
MKAAFYTQYGDPRVLSVKEVEKPTPKENEVLVRVYVTTVNRTDCANLTAKPFIMRFVNGLMKPKRQIPGTDFAGEIAAVGTKVKSFEVGDRVWGFGDQGICSQAEYLCLPEEKAMAHFPASLSYEQAAASVEGAHYACNFINKVKLAPGQKAIVNGATGAIGSALLQFLKYHELSVTAVCNTKNIERIKSLGADKIIDYTRQDFTDDDEKYDFVFDTVGKSTFGMCKPLLKDEGIYISSELGPGSQNIFLALFTPLLGGKKVIFPIPSDIKGSLTFIGRLVEKGKFMPVIDTTYPLENIAEAYRYVLTGQKTGNVVIRVQLPPH